MNTEQIPEFGIKRENEKRRDGGCGIVFCPKLKKFAVGKETNGSYRLFSGGVDENEDIKEGVTREVVEESGLHDFGHIEKVSEAYCHFYGSLRKVARFAHATCFLIILNDNRPKETKLEEHEKFTLTWVDEDELIENWRERNANKDFDHWFYFFEKAKERLTELGY